MKVSPAPIVKIDFKKPKRKALDLDEKLPGQSSSSSKQTPVSLLSPSPEEINAFYSELANNEHPVALLSTSAEYTELFETASCSEPNLPLLLSSLFKPEYHELSSHDLQKQCEEIFHSLKVSTSTALYLEQITRKQSGCLEWFDRRVGRITASVTYAVMGTNPDNPSKSLIEKICCTTYNSRAMTPALMWGKQHESDA